jgi:hypothetical protein
VTPAPASAALPAPSKLPALVERGTLPEGPPGAAAEAGVPPPSVSGGLEGGAEDEGCPANSGMSSWKVVSTRT